jgi:hypothetical protein
MMPYGNGGFYGGMGSEDPEGCRSAASSDASDSSSTSRKRNHGVVAAVVLVALFLIGATVVGGIAVGKNICRSESMKNNCFCGTMQTNPQKLDIDVATNDAVPVKQPALNTSILVEDGEATVEVSVVGSSEDEVSKNSVEVSEDPTTEKANSEDIEKNLSEELEVAEQDSGATLEEKNSVEVSEDPTTEIASSEDIEEDLSEELAVAKQDTRFQKMSAFFRSKLFSDLVLRVVKGGAPYMVLELLSQQDYVDATAYVALATTTLAIGMGTTAGTAPIDAILEKAWKKWGKLSKTPKFVFTHAVFMGAVCYLGSPPSNIFRGLVKFLSSPFIQRYLLAMGLSSAVFEQLVSAMRNFRNRHATVARKNGLESS